MLFGDLKDMKDIIKENTRYNHLLSFMACISNCIFFADTHGKYVAVNAKGLLILGVNYLDDAVGKMCEDMPFRGSELADEFRKYHHRALQGKTVKNLAGHYCGKNNDSLELFIGSYSPVYNEKNEILGTCTNGINVSNLFKKSILSYISYSQKFYSKNIEQFNISLDDNYSDLNLPARQSEIFFFLLRGKTNKEIAKFLNLSFRTVDYYVDILKNKLNCSKRSELIETGIMQGYLGVLPETLFNKFQHQ